MLQLWFLPKLPNNERCIFQQDGAPPHWALATRAFLNDELPGRWIGRCSARDQCHVNSELTNIYSELISCKKVQS